MAAEEQEDYDSFPFAYCDHGSTKPKYQTATAQALPVTSTLAKPSGSQTKAPARAQPQAPAQAQIQPPAPAQPVRKARAYFPLPQASPP